MSISLAVARSVGRLAQARGPHDDRLELPVALGHLAVAGLVGEQRRGRPGAPRPRRTPSPGRRGGRARRQGTRPRASRRHRPALSAASRRGRSTISAGRRSARGQRPGDGVGVALGQHEHEAGVGGVARRGRRRRRARGRGRCRPSTTTTTGRPSASVPDRRGGHASFTLVARQGAPRPATSSAAPTSDGSAITRLRSQRSGASRFSGWGAAPARRCARTVLDDRRERVRRRQVAVQHGERLAVVAADADLDPGAVLVDHDPGDLEPVDLADDRSPCSTTTSRPASPQQRRRRGRPRRGGTTGVGERRGRRRRERRARRPATPSAGRRTRRPGGPARRACSSTSTCSSSTCCWRAQASAGPSAALGTLVEQHPAGAPVGERGAAGMVDAWRASAVERVGQRARRPGRRAWRRAGRRGRVEAQTRSIGREPRRGPARNDPALGGVGAPDRTAIGRRSEPASAVGLGRRRPCALRLP